MLENRFWEVLENSCLYSFKGCQVINSCLKVKGKVVLHHPVFCCSCDGSNHKTLCFNLRREIPSAWGYLVGRDTCFPTQYPGHYSIPAQLELLWLNLWNSKADWSFWANKRGKAPLYFSKEMFQFFCTLLMKAGPIALVSLVHRGGLSGKKAASHSEVILLFPGTFMDGFPVIEGFATHSDFIALDLGEGEKKETERGLSGILLNCIEYSNVWTQAYFVSFTFIPT